MFEAGGPLDFLQVKKKAEGALLPLNGLISQNMLYMKIRRRVMRLDLKENIVSPFSDPSWIQKTLMGIAAQVLVVTGPALMGYMFSIIRQTANGEDEKLPEVDNIGKLWISGFIFTVFMVGLTIIPIGVVGGGVAMMAAGASQLGGDGAAPIALIGVVLVGLVVMALYLAILFLAPALMLRYAMTEQWTSLIDIPTAIGDMKHGVSDYLAIVFFPVIASLAMVALSALTLGIGSILAFPGGVLVMFIQARMIGNYYRLYFM